MNPQEDKEEQAKHAPERPSLEGHLADSREGAAKMAFQVDVRQSEAVDLVPLNTEVSETSEGVNERKGDPAQSQQQDDQNAQKQTAIRSQLQGDGQLSDTVVVKKVSLAIRQEIRIVEREVHALQKTPVDNAYELSISLDLLRKLRELLSEITHRSIEFVRQLWIQISQGKSVRETLV